MLRPLIHDPSNLASRTKIYAVVSLWHFEGDHFIMNGLGMSIIWEM